MIQRDLNASSVHHINGSYNSGAVCGVEVEEGFGGSGTIDVLNITNLTLLIILAMLA